MVSSSVLDSADTTNRMVAVMTGRAHSIHDDIERILLTSDQIARRIRELAGEIAASYPHPDQRLTLVTVLSGSIIFLADLIRHLPIRMKIGLVTVSSYKGKTTVGEPPRLLRDLDVNIANEDVLVIDDILDTGRTLRLVTRELRNMKPASLRTCVLLRKTAKAPKDVQADFIGFDIEDAFVVGYGLDYNDHYRNYPDIGVLRAEFYEAG